mmetsp:Transcript_19703/g.19803  ORF Transcript_19703/g.19803 Transcript_19703/m.19803 type:complete len:238 (+) Transcript_19703:53-766(+)
MLMSLSNIGICLMALCSTANSFSNRHLHRKVQSASSSSILCSNSNSFGLPNDAWNQFHKIGIKIATSAAILISSSQLAIARPEGVNRPDLLPQEQTSLIDVANFLSKGQEKRVKDSLAELEKETGYKLRVLCQSYPNTPGLAIKDYWGVDENTIVMVIDKGEGFNTKGIPSNVIRLNLGSNVEGVIPPMFWTRLTNKLGNNYYVKENGVDYCILNAVEAIKYCLEEKTCKDLPFTLN